MILEVKGHHSHIPQICFKLRGVYDLEFNRGTPNIIKKKNSVSNSTTKPGAALFFMNHRFFTAQECNNKWNHESYVPLH